LAGNKHLHIHEDFERFRLFNTIYNQINPRAGRKDMWKKILRIESHIGSIATKKIIELLNLTL
jgi:hypothetical protein